MAASNLPPCGIYRTTAAIGDGVPAGRLVYFHNHGNPGPGLYMPEKWVQNRAQFSERGFTMPSPEKNSALLQPLPNEGYYRVTKQFHCCEKKCRSFEPDELVQLGYTGEAEPILFVPEITATGFNVPETGSLVSTKELASLAPLKVAERGESRETKERAASSGGMLH